MSISRSVLLCSRIVVGKATCRALHIAASNKSYAYMPLSRNITKLRMNCVVSQLSTDQDSDEGKPSTEAKLLQEPILLYEGEFTPNIRRLRIVSMGSSLLSAFGMPLALTISTGSVPLIGQIAIISTALCISLSSTLFIQLVTFPYVTRLVEIPPLEGVNVDFEDRVFKATRINVFAQYKVQEFKMKDVVKDDNHPFASVKVNGSYYYIDGADLDVTLRHRFSNEVIEDISKKENE